MNVGALFSDEAICCPTWPVSTGLIEMPESVGHQWSVQGARYQNRSCGVTKPSHWGMLFLTLALHTSYTPAEKR